MAVPKRKTSKSRRDMRRTHKKTAAISITTCAQCGEPKRPHHLCLSCGTYKGRTLMDTDED
ncbi:MAG: 50S ribosomal protein L32 [Desulfobacteraceae bacterium]|nr:50S ribosomal protein L32 [Desulfobacteraceae bacterium]MBC2753351.1 50S ribosomal protein L32 [Desulfobacteraceae bacterium]